jgi:hypothetical protein
VEKILLLTAANFRGDYRMTEPASKKRSHSRAGCRLVPPKIGSARPAQSWAQASEFIMRGRGETMPQDGVREALAV